MTRIWHAVKDYDCRLVGEDAERIAREHASEHIQRDEFTVQVVDRKFIPVSVERPSDRPVVRFVKVWRVMIVEPAGRFPRKTILSIDCLTGEVVRVEHPKR